MSGVELAGLDVLVGEAVLVLVGGKVSVGWMLISVGLGLAQPSRKSMHGKNTKIITTIRGMEDLVFTGLSP